jgi:integrase
MKNARRTPYGWQFHTRIKGALVTEHFTFAELKNGHEPTPREVDDWKGKQRAIASGDVTPTEPSDDPTFAQDVRRYLLLVLTMKTYAWRKADLDLWIAVFGSVPRSEITSEMIRAQLEKWRKAGYAASTVNHRRTALMHLWTVLDGKSARNPARDTPRYREPALPPRDLSAAAVDAVLAAMADGDMKARLVLMRWTGWPQEQIRALAAQHIRWHVAVNMSRNKGKGVEGRWIPLLPEAWAALEQYRDRGLFGKDFDSWRLRLDFRQAAARARADETVPDAVRQELADVTPYQLRHAFGSLVAGVTGDDRATMELMIHSDIRQTHRYTKSTVDPRTAAALTAVHQRLATSTTNSEKSGVTPNTPWAQTPAETGEKS